MKMYPVRSVLRLSTLACSAANLCLLLVFTSIPGTVAAETAPAQEKQAAAPQLPFGKPKVGNGAAAPVKVLAPDTVAAVVNGEQITVADIDKEIERNPSAAFGRELKDMNPQLLGSLRKALLSRMVDRKLLLAAAEKRKIEASESELAEFRKQLDARFPNEEARKKQFELMGLTEESFSAMLKTELTLKKYFDETVTAAIKIDDSELKEAFDKNPSIYGQAARVHARHILIKLATDASKEDDKKAQDKALSISKQAKKKGADFAELAKKHSEGPTASKGGDLGFFEKRAMVPPFAEAAFAMKPGEVSDPVKTHFGYHVIKVEARKDAEEPKFENAKDAIRRQLKQQRSNQKIQEALQSLRSAAKIEMKL